MARQLMYFVARTRPKEVGGQTIQNREASL